MKEQIKSILFRAGANVCGVANIDRFSDAPEGFHPKDIFPACQSVVVWGLALPKGLTEVSPRLIYNHYTNAVFAEMDSVSFQAAKEIEALSGGRAVPLPSNGPYEYWDADKLEGRGLLSMKHAAVLAGLGTLGKSTLLLNRKYGSMLSLGAILTDIDLVSDPPAEDLCPEGCDLCVNNCPVQAIDGGRVNQLKCRQHTYGTNARGFAVSNCNRCRTICSV